MRRRKRWSWISIGPIEGDEEYASSYEPIDRDQLPSEQADRKQINASVKTAIEKLPDEFHKAVLLRDLRELSYADITRIIECPVGTAKPRINRGRSSLQQSLRSLAREVLGSQTDSARAHA